MTASRPTLPDGFANETSASEGVSLLDLEPLTTLLVHTCHSVYRIIVLQDTTVLLQGGREFPDLTVGELTGSGFGDDLFKLGWIGVGMRMELCSDNKFIVTSRVRAITTECNPSCAAHRNPGKERSREKTVH